MFEIKITGSLTVESWKHEITSVWITLQCFSDVFISYKKTSETLSTAGQKTTAAISTLGNAITRKIGDMRYTISLILSQSGCSLINLCSLSVLIYNLSCKEGRPQHSPEVFLLSDRTKQTQKLIQVMLFYAVTAKEDQQYPTSSAPHSSLTSQTDIWNGTLLVSI